MGLKFSPDGALGSSSLSGGWRGGPTLPFLSQGWIWGKTVPAKWLSVGCGKMTRGMVGEGPRGPQVGPQREACSKQLPSKGQSDKSGVASAEVSEQISGQGRCWREVASHNGAPGAPEYLCSEPALPSQVKGALS